MSLSSAVRPRLLASLALLVTAGCEPSPPAIRATVLERHVAVLAADRMAGRETGRPGVERAEEYIAATFEEIGLAPLPGNADYYLPVTLYRRGYDEAATGMELRAGDRKWDGAAGEVFRPFDFSDDGVVEGEVVLAGYGITAPEQDYDDYRDLDVKDKIVLVLRHDPSESVPEGSYDGSTAQRHAHFRTKASNAAAHGALGMILVTDPLNHEPEDDLRVGGSLDLEPGESNPSPEVEGFVAVHASRSWVDSALSTLGTSLEEWQRSVDSGRPVEVRAGLSARITTRRDPEAQPVQARNVAGFIEGHDPELTDQWIVVGAHHDHIGAFAGEGDTVYNGADDNASGVSGLLELAASFAADPYPLRRSIAFVTFTGEEKGLLGSRTVVEREGIPLERVVFMLNLDMIGRNADRPLRVYGDGYVRGLRSIVEEANAIPGLRLEFAGAGYAGNSDHHPFYEKDLPFCFLFTGVHDDYHRLGDHPEKLDYSRMVRIVLLARGLLAPIARREEPPGFVHHVTWFGAQVELLDSSRVPTVTQVDPGSPAERIGLLAGDVVVALDESELDDPREVGRRFREIEPGSSTSLRVRRDEEQVVLEIHRATPGYLGVAPRAIDEELRAQYQLRADQGVLLLRIVPEGPAAEAGLLPEDILLRLGGRAVNQDNLTFLLEQIGEGQTVDAEVLRGGDRQSIDVTLGRRP